MWKDVSKKKERSDLRISLLVETLVCVKMGQQPAPQPTYSVYISES